MMASLLFSPSSYSFSSITQPYTLLLAIPERPTSFSFHPFRSSTAYPLTHLSSPSSINSRHAFFLSSKCQSASPDFFSPTAGLPPFDPEDDDKWDSSKYEALLKGGEQVTSVLQEMIKLLEDMELDEASEAVAVEIAAQGVIGKRVDEMESGFMMALDYMIQIAEKDNDDQVTDKMPDIHQQFCLLRFQSIYQ